MKNIIAIMLVMFSTLTMAAEVERRVTGYGQSYEDAVSNGLIQAVEQQFGVKLSSRAAQQISIRQSIDEILIEDSNNQQVEREAEGSVSSYDVLAKRCEENTCEVDLAVTFTVYECAGRCADNLRKIGVMPFSGGDSRFNSSLSNHLLEQLTQSRRFAVIDRQHDQAYQEEKAIWESPDTPVAEKARLGQVHGLDYVLLGRVVNTSTRQVNETITITGESRNYIETSSTVQYQLIEVATRQIQWAGTVDQVLSNYDLVDAGRKTAEDIVLELLDNIFPIRVISVRPGSVVFNQGGATVPENQCYDIFALGEQMFDPYTDDFLGQDETRVATVQVNRVLPKMSYAALVSGQIDDIAELQIARQIECQDDAPVSQTGTRDDSIVIPRSGGVIL